MAITTYSELKTAITTWMDRSDVSGNASDFVRLAEARLNRILGPLESNATLTGTAGSRTVDVSALTIAEPISLFLKENSADDEFQVEFQPQGSFAYIADSGMPGNVALDGDNLIFDRPLDLAYSMRFRYRGRLALSDSVTTNELLDNHPDVYLAASIMWGGVFVQDQALVAGFKQLLDEFVFETEWQRSQAKRGVVRPDPALASMIGRATSW